MTATAVEYKKPVPRPYQIEARDNFLAGTGNMLIQLPTGTGKTQTAVGICDVYPGERVLFLAHTGTLVYQTCHAFLKNGMWPNVEKADEYTGGPYLPDAREWKKMFKAGKPPNDWFRFNRAWVSTIQTFCDRVDKYHEDPFDLIVTDECHRAMSKQWRKLSLAWMRRKFSPFSAHRQQYPRLAIRAGTTSAKARTGNICSRNRKSPINGCSRLSSQNL